MKSRAVVVLITAASVGEARKLTRFILQKKAAACINILPQIDSWYWWQKKITHGKEIMLLVKTHRSALGALAQILKKHHSYTVPELIALPIEWGSPPYLDWMRQNIESH